jgi:hypothetical protein
MAGAAVQVVVADMMETLRPMSEAQVFLGKDLRVPMVRENKTPPLGAAAGARLKLLRLLRLATAAMA